CVIRLFFFSSRRRHTRFSRDWSSDVCSSDLFDISEKLDDFLKNKASMLQVIFHYYALGSVPFFLNMLTPLMNFIAVIFFTSKMADQTEIVPILSGGMSFNRFLRPY